MATAKKRDWEKLLGAARAKAAEANANLRALEEEALDTLLSGRQLPEYVDHSPAWVYGLIQAGVLVPTCQVRQFKLFDLAYVEKTLREMKTEKSAQKRAR